MNSKQYKLLKDQLTARSVEYYNGKPTIPDDQFDKLYLQLIQYEDENGADPDSPSQRIVEYSGVSKIPFYFPMKSLNKVSDKALANFIQADKNNMEYQPKFDGGSVCLYYHNQILKGAFSRTGKSVFHVLKYVNGVNKSCTLAMEHAFIKGEIVAPKENPTSDEVWNPRNYAVGALNIVGKPKMERLEHLRFIACERWVYYKDSKLFEKMALPSSFSMATIEEAREYVDSDPPYPCDGIVIKAKNWRGKLDDMFTKKSYTFAVAYKWLKEEIETTVKGITFSVGRTGKITPRAEVDPVEIDGSINTYATLNNFEYAEDIGIGARVTLSKRGDIIPHIESIISPVKIEVPTECEVCGHELSRHRDSKDIFCKNWRCMGRVVARLEHFASVMKIKHLGIATIIELVENKGIMHPSDFYRDFIFSGERNGSNILESVEQSRNAPYHQVIEALGFDGIGTEKSKILCKIFPHISELMTLLNGYGKADFLNISGFGLNTYDDFVSDLLEFHNSGEIDRLAEIFSLFEIKEETVSDALKGQLVVITGNIPYIGERKESWELIKKLGGSAKDSISKDVTLLVVGEGHGANKIEKAQKYGIPVMDAQIFYDTYLKSLKEASEEDSVF